MNRMFLTWVMLFCVLASWQLTIAQDLDIGFDEKDTEAEVSELLGEEPTLDVDLVKASHLSMLSGWQGVKHQSPVAGETNAPCHWMDHGGIVTPTDDGAISALIEVPESGAYRISLRQQLNAGGSSAVKLSMAFQKAGPAPGGKEKQVTYSNEGAPLEYAFGEAQLPDGMAGRDIEKKTPVRFEREVERVAVPSGAIMAWEYWDADLKKGVYRASLSSSSRSVRASALFLSRSKDFRPSLSDSITDNTLGRIYMRFRTTDPGVEGDGKYTVDASLGYHWRGRRAKGSSQDAWGWPIGTTAATTMGEWTPYLDATDAILPGPGPWSTCGIGVHGVKDGELEVQLAWFMNEQANELTFKTSIGGGRSMFRVPHGGWVQTHSAGPAWGMWSKAKTDEVMPQEAVIGRYFAWGADAVKTLGLKPDHPFPKKVLISTGCGVAEPNRARAAEMLAKLGINWIDGAPESIVKKYGLHDESGAYNVSDPEGMAKNMPEEQRKKLTKVKIGDEISTYTEPSEINSDAAKLAAFRTYLEVQAKLSGMSLEAFVGVRDRNDIQCIGSMSADPGRFERRIYYHSQRFCHLATCESYDAITRALEKVFPNVHVYNNYSPHPIFLTGATMNGSDWFVLCRNKAQTLGWGEDWAYYNGWDLGTQYQCTSFYAALVDCAIRKHRYPGGFYVGSNCGGSAEKIFACIAQGVTWLHLYDWGPIDRWAEGSNAWSENEREYLSVLKATAALGPADEIIGEGIRERRRTAILYNRSHEILTGGEGRLNYDWMWTFFGLKSSQIPVEVIIEEDLNQEDLKGYDCVVVGGYNLSKQSMQSLKSWVEAGGLLIGCGGAAMRDIYNDPMQETDDLFGCRQRAPRQKEESSLTNATFTSSEWFPAATLALEGPRFMLEPTKATTLAKYPGGKPAATVNSVGKGNAILLGFQPGLTARANGARTGLGHDWLSAPFLKRLGRQRVEFDHTSSEATLFEHKNGLAVMLLSLAGPSPEGGSSLSVQTDRPIKEVFSALHGPLKWKQENGWVDIRTKRIEPVDVVVLR